MKLKPLFLSLLVLTLILAACGDAARGTEPDVSDQPVNTNAPHLDDPVSSDDDTAVDEPIIEVIEGDIIMGEAMVESVDVLVMESFPVQINVRATGYVGDGCTRVGNITTEQDEDTFRIHISTVRPADAICTQQLVAFDELISLDVDGLEAGTYMVNVNGRTSSFTLDIDNWLPEE